MELARQHRAQSFVEFALVLPILLLVLLGVVELVLFMGAYINLVDLTREAARFASNREPFSAASQGDYNCSTPNSFNFFWDTSCIFSPLAGKPCPYPTFCNGFNSTLGIKSEEDDILISVFTETGVDDGSGHIVPQITDNAASEVPWVWSNHDPDAAHNDNWRRDCNRLSTAGSANPAFTKTTMQSYVASSSAMPNKGFVVVEGLYCYHQVLNIPILAQFLPNPIRIHAYTIMPLPAAQPTPTPRAFP